MEEKLFTKEERITFSISTSIREKIGELYLLAKNVKIPVASAIRHNLTLYDGLLNEELSKLTPSEVDQLDKVSTIISLSYICRLEGKPDRDLICEHMQKSGNESIIEYIRNMSNIRLYLVLDRARSKAASYGDANGIRGL